MCVIAIGLKSFRTNMRVCIGYLVVVRLTNDSLPRESTGNKQQLRNADLHPHPGLPNICVAVQSSQNRFHSEYCLTNWHSQYYPS